MGPTSLRRFDREKVVRDNGPTMVPNYNPMTAPNMNRPDDDAVDPLARKRKLTRRLFVVIASAILTIVACVFLGMRFGSADQVILTLMTIAFVALLLRVFRSKGRFRFASLLLLTAFCALLFRMVLTPLKRQSDQRAAIAMVESKGGSVSTYGGNDVYPQNAHGWVLNDSGYLYPALLAYIEKKYLNPVEVYKLKIPSSLLDNRMWNSLQCKNLQRVEVLLDGSGNAEELNKLLSEQIGLFPDYDTYFYRTLVFVADKLQQGDIDYMNSMRWGGIWREMPTIRLGIESDFEPKLLEGIEDGFELIDIGMHSDRRYVERVIQVNKLKRLSLNRHTSPNVLKSISKRSQPLARLTVYNEDLDSETWPMLCKLTNCSSMQFDGLWYQGQLLRPEILKQLSQNNSIKELVLYLDESQAPAIPFLMGIKGLLRLVVHCEAKCDANMIAAIENSSLEDVWLDMQPESDEIIQWKPWMGRLKSLKVGAKQIDAPK